MQIFPRIPLFFSIADTDFGLETNQFCNAFGYNGKCKFWGAAEPKTPLTME